MLIWCLALILLILVIVGFGCQKGGSPTTATYDSSTLSSLTNNTSLSTL